MPSQPLNQVTVFLDLALFGPPRDRRMLHTLQQDTFWNSPCQLANPEGPLLSISPRALYGFDTVRKV